MGEKLIQAPDGSVISFPDSMSDEAISGVMRKQFPPKQVTPPLPPPEQTVDMRSPEAQRIDRPMTWGDEMSRFRQIANEPRNLLQQGLLESRTNPVAGSGDISNSLLKYLIMPVSLAGEGAHAVGVPDWLTGTLAAPFTLAETASKPVGGLLGTAAAQYLNYSPEKVAQAQRAWQGAGGMAGGLYLGSKLADVSGELATKAPETFRKASNAVADRLAGAAHRPPYAKQTGIEKFDRQIGTVLNENLAPTRSGLEKTGKLLNELDNTSQPIRNDLTKQGVKIDFSGFKDALNQTKEGYANSADLPEYSAGVDGIVSRIDRLQQKYPNGVPLNAAWDFKSSLQRMVGDKYDQFAGLTKEAAKTGAHLLLDDIISKAPELRDIGLRQRDVIEAQSMIGRRVAINQSRQLLTRAGRAAAFGVGTGLFAHDWPTALAVGAGEYLAESPRVQHQAAIAFHRLGQLGAGNVNPYAGYTPTPFPSSGTTGTPSDVGGTQPTNSSTAVGFPARPTVFGGPFTSVNQSGVPAVMPLLPGAQRLLPEGQKALPSPSESAPTQPPINPQSIGDIFPNYKAPTVMELPKEDFPVQFKNSTEAINYGQNATKEQAAQLKEMRDLALRKGKKAGNSDQAAQWNTHAMKYREALEEYQKANAPKSGSQPDFASYRKYLSNGGDLNFSDWKTKGKPSK